MSAFLLHLHNKSLSNQVNEQLRITSDNAQSQLSIFLDTVLHELETTSHQVERMAQKDYQQYNLLKTLQKNNPAFSALAFFDINGIIRSSVSDLKDETIPEYFTENHALFTIPFNSGDPYITKLTSENSQPAIGLSQPVNFLDNSYVIGVIAAIIPYDSLQSVINQFILPPNQNILILNNEGQVLAQKSQNDEKFADFPTEQELGKELTINHIRYITASSPLDFHGQHFIIIASIDANKSWAPTARSFMLLTLIIILLLLLLAFVGWTIYKKIIAPLQQLSDSSAIIVQGKKATISKDSDTEFQTLANTMNTLNYQLKESNLSLKNEILRRRRQEKTANMAKIDAEKANQAKSIFLANMSHEIRTPLHGIIGMLEMLEKNPLNKDQEQLLTMMKVSTQRLHTMVNSILDLSQIESGKFKLHHSPFSLSELFTEVVEFMQIQVKNQEKDITISSEQTSDIPDALVGDSGRIRQILINLLNNSIKFSKKGTIHLTVELKSKPDEDTIELLFSVTDNGTGIPDEAQHAIFEAFARGSLDTDKVVEGTGLGLAISAEFVQAMKGKLWLEKTDENGTTFCFTIHCGLATEAFKQDRDFIKKAKQEKRLSGIRIFLAEDEYINQRIIAAYLEEQGGLVTVCSNGQELLDTMKDEIADIILMDIRMPVLDGLKATKAIRVLEKNSAHLPIPIVALTAQATTDFEEECRDAGMDDYLTKPIPFDRLVEIVCNLVGKV